MTSKIEKTGRRRVWFVEIYSPEQRIELKEQYVREAQDWEPPETYLVPKYVLPGDAGYDESEEEEVIVWSDKVFEREVPNENYK